MGRVNIRPPEGYFDWPKEQQLEWIRQLQAEVRGDDDGSDPDEGLSSASASNLD